MRNPLAITLAAGALAALCAFPALAQPAAWEGGSDALKPVPRLAARVTDLTSTLSDAERSALESKLAAFEEKTGAQMAVLVVPTTQPEPVETYAIRVADAWKVGRKGRDDGVLLVVAKNDRRLRLEVGYGLEGAIPDAIAKRIVAEDIAPRFREGRYAAGIEAGVDRVVAIVEKGELPPPAKRSPRTAGAGGLSWEMIALLALVVVPAVGGILKSIFGKLGGATVGAGLVGGITWFVLGSVALAVGAAVVAWIAILLIGGVGSAASGRGGGGVWLPGGGGWGGGGGMGGGGWSGGGGGFGGGGASGDW
jgi:uncharacterized protein